MRGGPPQRAKVALPQRHRFTASTACLFSLFDPPHRLRERYHCNARSSQAALRRSDLCGELDFRCRPFPTPGFLRQKQVAQDDLTWCAANIAKAPDIGWLREVDFRLGKLTLADGDQAKAQDYLLQSADYSLAKQFTLLTPFSDATVRGH